MSVPRLRFPEFRDAGEWEEKKAGSLFSNRIEPGEEDLPIYSVTMNEGLIKRALLEREFDDIADSTRNKKSYHGDIVYNMMRMWQGASGIATEDCMVSPAYVVLEPANSLVSLFFAYLFKLPKYIRLLTTHSQGLTEDRLRLYYKDFSHIGLIIPQPPEQQKIAECLSSLDALIAAQARKIEALAMHKKGLMQHLFPASDGGTP